MTRSRASGGPTRVSGARLTRPRAVYREDALPYGSAGTRLRRGRAPADSSGPATGDWLSGRAPRSHRGGHWFDPSIAHQVRGYAGPFEDGSGSHSCSQVVGESIRSRLWRADVAGAKTASTSITRGSAATPRRIGTARAAGGAWSVSSPVLTADDGARRSLAETRPRSGPSSPSCTTS